MDQQHLRDTLDQLHAEIRQIDTVDDATRGALQELMADIQSLMERPGAATLPHDQPLRERLRNHVTYFEITHPRLSASISRALDALVQLGV
jgi:hypothetical protein